MKPSDVLDSHRGSGEQARGSMGRGARWVGLSQAGMQGVRVLAMLVLTQILSPSEFGIVSLVMVASIFVDRVIGDTGTSSAIIQHDTITQGLVSSVFMLNIGIGAVTSLLFVVAAGPISWLLRNPDTVPFIRAIGLLALVNASSFVPLALFRRRLQFKNLAMVNVTNAVVTGLASISLAFAGYGPWALVWGNVTGAAAATLVAWLRTSWRPSFYFSRNDLSRISTFSAYLSAKNLFGYISFAGDRYIVGALLGTTALGYYGNANRLMRYPTQAVAQTYRSTVFPNLAKIQHDPQAVADAYRRSVASIAFLMMPLCVGVAAVAEPLVVLVLPQPKWDPAIMAPVLAIIAVTSGLQALAATTGSLYTARGRTDLVFRWQVVSSLVYLACYLIGSLWGVEGVAGGFLAGTIILFYPAFAIPLRLIDVKVWPVLGEAFVTMLAAFVAGGCAYGAVEYLAGRGELAIVQMVAAGLMMALVFGLYVLVARPPALNDLIGLIRRR